MSNNSSNKTKQVWKATGKLFANVGYQWRSTGKKVALGKLNYGYQWRPTRKKFALGELCPLTKLYVQCRTGHPLVSGLRLFKTYDGESFKAQELCGKSSSNNQIRDMITSELSWVMELWAICDSDLELLQKSILALFVIYNGKGYRIYNKRTRRLMETIHVTFDEMHPTMAPVHMSSGPEPIIMTPGQLESGPAPRNKELKMLFQPMFDEYVEQSRVNEPVPSATAVNAQVVPPGIAEEPTLEDSPITHDALHPSFNLVNGEPSLTQSSSGNLNSAEPNQVAQPPDHLRR
ncbi:hypothetical protein Tco_0529089 [Tanacetum coccineum]